MEVSELLKNFTINLYFKRSFCGSKSGFRNRPDTVEKVWTFYPKNAHFSLVFRDFLWEFVLDEQTFLDP